MKKIWFRAKRYGWGWYPVAWQGWAVVAVFVALQVLNFLRIDAHSHSVSDTLQPFIIQAFLLGVILIYVCYRTGEKPRWQWGVDDTGAQ